MLVYHAYLVGICENRVVQKINRRVPQFANPAEPSPAGFFQNEVVYAVYRVKIVRVEFILGRDD